MKGVRSRISGTLALALDDGQSKEHGGGLGGGAEVDSQRQI